MVLDATFGDPKSDCDLLVGRAPQQQIEHFLLLRRRLSARRLPRHLTKGTVA